MNPPVRLILLAALFALASIPASGQAPPAGIPLITSSPTSVTRPAGVSSTLSVTATGNATLAYQWLRGSATNPTTEIAGANGPSYTLSSPTTADTAYYSVRISNSLGSITTVPVLATYEAASGTIASTILPTSVGSTTNEGVNAVVPAADGSFVIGGSFADLTLSTGEVVSRGFLARIRADGSLDPDFAEVTESTVPLVNAIVRDDLGRYLVGGPGLNAFGIYPDDLVRPSLCRILANGAVDASFNSPFSAPVTALNAIAIETSGTLLVGGNFPSITGIVGTKHLLRISAATGLADPAFVPAIPAQTVNAICLQADGKILVGHAQGLARLNLDGGADPTFTYAGGTTAVNAIQPVPGGDFLLARSGSTSSLIRITSGGGLVTPFPATGTAANTSITEILALPSGNFVVGGTFTTYGGTQVNRIAHIAADGTRVAGLDTGTGSISAFNNNVNALAIDSQNRLWVGGNFTTYKSSSRRKIACLATAGAATADPGAPVPDAYTQSLITAGIPADRRGTADDPDGDGSSNLDEFTNATNPASASSVVFRLTTAGQGATVTVTPAAAGGLYAANTPVELAVTPAPGLTFLGWGPSSGAADTTQPLGVVMNQNRNLTAYAGLPLADSLDTPALTWTTGGSVLWTGTAATSKDGIDAATASGLSQAGQETWLETAVTGPGVLTLRWKLTTTNPDGAILQVMKNGNPLQPLAATAGAFNTYSVYLSDTGPLTLRLRLSANVNGGVSPTDTAVIDKFYFGPFIAPALLPTTNLTATSGTLNWAEVPATSGYDIQVATNPAFTGTVKYYWAERDVLSQAVSSLIAGTQYHYRITAYGPSGTTATKSTGSFTPAERQSQSIDFPQPAAKTFGDPAFPIAATATSGLPVAFEVVSGPGTVSGGTITLTGGGDLVIRATQAGDASYFPAIPVERTFAVAKATQSLTFPQPPDLPADPLAFSALTASANSNLPIAFSVDSGPATIIDGMLQLTGTGTIRITANQPGNADYLPAAPVTREFAAVAPPAATPVKSSGAGKLTGGSSSAAKAISGDASVIVGWATNAGSNNEAVLGSPAAGLTGLGDLAGGSFTSQANAVSHNGAVVVGYGISAAGLEAFRWTTGGMIGLGDLPGGSASSQANAVSQDGSVVVGQGQNSSFINEAFRWTAAGGMAPLGLLAGGNYSQALGVSGDGSTVVGVGNSPGITEMAFRWTLSGGLTALGDLPGGEVRSRANAISADGSVIVGQSTSANGREAFRWTAAGGLVGLGDLPGGSFQSEALATSANGAVIVGTATTASGNQAFVWDAAHGMRSLRDLLTAAGLSPGWVFHSATGVSADGRFITGAGTNRNGASEAWLLDLNAPVIPATVVLLWTEDLPQTEPSKANSVLRLGYDNNTGKTAIATQTGAAGGGFNGVEYADGKILVPNRATTLGTRVHDPRFSQILVTNVFGYDLDAAPGVLWQSNGNGLQIIRNQVSATPTLNGGVYDHSYTPQQTTGTGLFTFPLQAVGPTVYFANPTTTPPGLYKMNVDGSGITPVHTSAAPVIYDFEIVGNWVYFGNIANQTIQRINTDGTGLVTLVTNAEFPNGIDVTAEGIYWSELLNGRIRRADLDGGHVSELVTDLVSPRGVVVLPLSFAPVTDPLTEYLANAGVASNQRGPNDDPDRDGIPNLVEYALELSPNTSSSAALPLPVPGAGQLTLTYRRARADVSYAVQASSDLTNGTWTTLGVDQGTPAADGTTTARIPLTDGAKFLRISVTR